jgi:hypothetical protein
MTPNQTAAYETGYADRNSGKPMAESFTLSPATANAYTNGYRDACYDADDGRGREGWYE